MTSISQPERGRSNATAVALAIACTGIFSLIFVSGRFAGELASPLQIMFLRYAGGFLTVVAVALLQGETWFSLQSKLRWRHALRALSGAFGGAAIIYGNAQMPIVDVTAISLLSPVFLILLGIVILSDRLTGWRMLGIAISLAGAIAVVVSRGALTNADPSYLLPAAVVVAGSLSLAVEGLLIKILATADRPLVTLAHVNLFGMLILLVPAVLTWRSTGWINLALLGIGPLAIFAQYLNIRANMLAHVSVLAPLSYTSLVFAALIGWLCFAELPTPGVVLGALVIVIGGALLALSRR
ncbi:MAG TPA: DMT family transporter [Devosia sp.]|jgi:drug/metabolite transporter (DMT)-like permease|uniref:DMT family transporter n=1 Tax=Devosia sp. TaxID=1871048 RepID=UPI002DDD9A11|nr:DMT family transporter [Devosia sp.]HEV2517339.1 DMT family transporter [Devosia sp.]